MLVCFVQNGNGRFLAGAKIYLLTRHLKAGTYCHQNKMYFIKNVTCPHFPLTPSFDVYKIILQRQHT